MSYNKADRAWAVWIAWQLEEKGYTTILQAWDFKPGVNFVIEMDRAMQNTRRTLALLSPDYLNALYTQPEWAVAFRRDPTGEKGMLVPIRVRACELEGLLASIVYIDLTGHDELQAQHILLTGVTNNRTKPTSKPVFPGKQRSVVEKPNFPPTQDNIDDNFPIRVHHQSLQNRIESSTASTMEKEIKDDIREQIVREPLLGAKVLSDYLSIYPQWSSKRTEVDLRRTELERIEKDGRLFGRDDPSYKAARNKVVYRLLEIWQEIEELTL